MYFVQTAQRLIVKLVFSHQLVGDTGFVPASSIVLGKFQYVRNKFLNIDELDIETVKYKTIPAIVKNFTAKILPTLDGKSFLPFITPYDDTPLSADTRVAKFLCHTSCKNFALAFTGYFDLNTVSMVCHVEGDA
jgi:hypothetical protein